MIHHGHIAVIKQFWTIKCLKQTLTSARKTNAATENSTINITAVDTLWDKNTNLSEDDSSMENSLNMFGKVMIVLNIISTCSELLIDIYHKSHPSCIDFKIGRRFREQGNIICYVIPHTLSCVKLLAFL